MIINKMDYAGDGWQPFLACKAVLIIETLTWPRHA